MDKIKVDIISGFLGAGKTTFIKKLVRDVYSDEKVVILENEFGKINIDEETLARENIIVKGIQAGCICCSVAGDFSRAIMEIIDEYRPDRILIEPTGIAKLSDVKKTVLSSEISELCELDQAVTIVDAKNYYARILVSKDFFENQLRSSDIIFLSKTDQLTDGEIDNVVSEISKLQTKSPIIAEPWDNLTPAHRKELISSPEYSPAKKQPVGIIKYHQNDFESYEVITEKNIAQDIIRQFLYKIESGLYGDIHRVKGICFDTQIGWYSVDFVPGETKIAPLPENTALSGRISLCMIGRELRKDKLDKDIDLLELLS